MKIALGSTFSVAVTIGLVVSGPAGAQQSITGKWAIDKKCSVPLSFSTMFRGGVTESAGADSATSAKKDTSPPQSQPLCAVAAFFIA
jgi:hypothetical protein